MKALPVLRYREELAEILAGLLGGTGGTQRETLASSNPQHRFWWSGRGKPGCRGPGEGGEKEKGHSWMEGSPGRGGRLDGVVMV